MNQLPIYSPLCRIRHLSGEQKFLVLLHIIVQFSAAIGRSVYLHDEPKVFGNLCMVLVGESGCGKTLAMEHANSLFKSLPSTFTASLVRKARALKMEQIKELLAASDPTVYHVNEYFADQLEAACDYRALMTSTFCQLIDGRHIYPDPEDVSRGHEPDYYHYSFMGHITPDDLKRAKRPIPGGLASRIMWIQVPKNIDPVICGFPEDIKAGLAGEIFKSLRFAGEHSRIQMNPDAASLTREYSEKVREEYSATQDQLMRAMLSRFPLHVKKFSLVLAMLRRASAVGQQEVEEGITLLERSRLMIKTYFSHKSLTMEERILEYMRNNGQVGEQALLLEMEAQSSAKLKKILKKLMAMGKIKGGRIEQDDGTFPYLYSLA